MTEIDEHGGVATASTADAPTEQLPAVPAVPAGSGAGGDGNPDRLVGLETRDLSAWFGDHKVLERVSRRHFMWRMKRHGLDSSGRSR